MRDCPRVLNSQISSLDCRTLDDRCSQCLTVQELHASEEGQRRLVLADATVPFRSGETVHEALNEAGGTYEATGSPDKPAPPPQLNDANSLSTTASFNRATTPEINFAPWLIPESVLFLYRDRGPDVTRDQTPIATAFVLSVPYRGSRGLARFLVTARHVVDPAWAHCADLNPASIQVRLNRRGGGVGYETIALTDEHGRSRYMASSDPTADVAIMLLDRKLIPDLDSYKFIDTPSRLLPTNAELSYISSRQRGVSRNLPGQPVTTASLRSQVPDGPAALPISGSGVLFSTGNETVNIQCGDKTAVRPLRVWLIDASIEEGFSGAPVYTSLTRDGELFPSTILLGVQSVAWRDRGVTGITPASALVELIGTATAPRGHDRHKSRSYGPDQLAELYRGANPGSRDR